MTNQVNQYEHHMVIQEAYQIHDSDEYFKARPQLECGDRRKVFYAGHIRGYQAATKARDSEINSLKQRVEELQADNLRLMEALERIVKAEDNIYKCEDDYQGDVIGKLSDIHFKAYNKARKVLSSTPAQSLAEHDNEVIEKCGQTVAKYANLQPIADEIRALKVTP